MKIEEVLSRLCYYDIRNPDGITLDEEIPKETNDCFCDNCFYGRDKLAKYILELLNYEKSKF